MPGSIRRAAVVAVAAVAVALVGGCSGSGATAGSPSPQNAGASTGGDPKALLAEVPAATFAAGSVRFEVTMQVSSGGRDTTTSGTGTFDFARKAGDLTMAAAGGPASEVIMDGGNVYTRPAGESRWLQMNGAAMGGQFDPAQQLDTLQKVSNDVRVVGTEDLRGEQVTHLAYTIDPADLVESSGTTGPAAEMLRSGGPIPGDLYIDDEGRARKAQTTMSTTVGGTTSTATVAVDYLEFGVPVAAQAPDPSTVDTLGGS
ncbi:hypothetical protein GCM10010464_63680 [Pseudonocardia yunnanensis]|uniref:LppX_LprAFG lipoprotein n=1 Tax=Pseudonocardia yunnanensis TaxID=58107 RepID=A0ABW4ETJ5_9PSEU